MSGRRGRRLLAGTALVALLAPAVWIEAERHGLVGPRPRRLPGVIAGVVGAGGGGRPGGAAVAGGAAVGGRPGSWLLAGTGLGAGSRLPNLVGPEYDRVTRAFPTPRGVELILHSPLRCRLHRSFSDMTYYAAASGAGVVDAGTSSWICQLDQVCAAGRNSATTAAAVRRITVNLLRRFAAGPAGRLHPSVSNLDRFDIQPSGL